MSKSNKVIVNDLHQFNLSKNDVNTLNHVETRHGHFHILEDHISHTAELVDSDFQNRIYTVKINNTPYQVKILSDQDVLIEQLGLETEKANNVDVILAPMPGLILDISVNIGDRVVANTPLLVLEAMKMENSIVSPSDAIIKNITVNKGDTVHKGDLLIEFE